MLFVPHFPDTIPKSRRVLDLIRKLTCNHLSGDQRASTRIKQSQRKHSAESYLRSKETPKIPGSVEAQISTVQDFLSQLENANVANLSDSSIEHLTQGMVGWPKFSEVR